MNKADRKALARYIRTAADHMELRDWTFELSEDSAPEDTLAWFANTDGQRHAVIWFCDDFRKKPAELQRGAVAHELIHAHLASVQDQVRYDLRGALGAKAHKHYDAAFTRNLELAVDALERIIAKTLPLIAWPT